MKKNEIQFVGQNPWRGSKVELMEIVSRTELAALKILIARHTIVDG